MATTTIHWEHNEAARSSLLPGERILASCQRFVRPEHILQSYNAETFEEIPIESKRRCRQCFR